MIFTQKIILFTHFFSSFVSFCSARILFLCALYETKRKLFFIWSRLSKRTEICKPLPFCHTETIFFLIFSDSGYVCAYRFFLYMCRGRLRFFYASSFTFCFLAHFSDFWCLCRVRLASVNRHKNSSFLPELYSVNFQFFIYFFYIYTLFDVRLYISRGNST